LRTRRSRSYLDDRRFATAYNAALQASKMAILCAGYQLASTPGHHRLTFEAARLALGGSAAGYLDFFEACRRKRNVIDYDHASVATHTEAGPHMRIRGAKNTAAGCGFCSRA
jgi:hypothetical protein